MSILIPALERPDPSELARLDFGIWGANPTVWLERLRSPLLAEALEIVYSVFVPAVLMTALFFGDKSDFVSSGTTLFSSHPGSYCLTSDTSSCRRGDRAFCCDRPANLRSSRTVAVRLAARALDRIESAHYDCFPSGHTEMTILAWWGSRAISTNLFRAMFALHFGCHFCYSLPTLSLHGRCSGRRHRSRRLNLDDALGLSALWGARGAERLSE